MTIKFFTFYFLLFTALFALGVTNAEATWQYQGPTGGPSGVCYRSAEECVVDHPCRVGSPEDCTPQVAGCYDTTCTISNSPSGENGSNSRNTGLFNIWRGTGSGGATCNISDADPCTLCDSLIVVGNIIDALMVLIIPIATLMIILGGMRIFTAGGSEDAFSKGKDIVKNAIIGVAIALASWVIVNEVLHVLSGRADFPWSQIECRNETVLVPNSFGGGDASGSGAGRTY